MINQKKFNNKFVDKINEITYYYEQSNPIDGINYLNDILTTQSVKNSLYVLPSIYVRYAQLYAKLDQFDLQIKYQLLANKYFSKNKDVGAYYWSMLGIGNILYKIKNYTEAIKYYKESYKGFAKTDEGISSDQRHHAYAVCLDNIGLCYDALNVNDSALKYYHLAQKYRYMANHFMDIKLSHYNLGMFFLNKNILDSAYSNLEKSYNIKTPNNTMAGTYIEFNKFHIKTMIALSQYFKRINKLDSSEFYYKSAIDYIGYKIPIPSQIMLLSEMADMLVNLHENQISLQLVLKAQKLIEEHSIYIGVQEINKLLADIYYYLGQFDQSMQYQKVYEKFLDSIQTVSRIRNLDLEINSQKLEIELEEINSINQEKSEKVQNLTYLAILLLFVIIIVLLIIYFYHKLNITKSELNDKLIASNEELNNINTRMHESQQTINEANNELKKLNKQLVSSNNDLEESNNTKNMLFSLIAHDLKNALSSGYAMITTLYQSFNYYSNEEKQEYVEFIYQSFSGVYKLLENLLVWSTAIRNKLKPHFDLNNLYYVVLNNINLYQQQIKEKNISIINNLNNALFFVFDASLMDTVIRNILNNAIKYSHNGGFIYFDYELINEYIILSIRDEGVGMPKDKAQNIFKSGHNVSTMGTSGEKGTGLGLLICYEFVKIHRGEIWFESEIDKGSVCKIKLPTNQLIEDKLNTNEAK